MPSNDNKSKKKKIILPLSAWLGYLLTATLITGSVTLARFTATTSGDEMIRVARFSVSANPIYSSAERPVINEHDAYIFEVCNDSEAAVKYKVVIGNLPKDVAVQISTETDVETISFDTTTENAAVTLMSAEKTLDIGESENCKLKFIAGEGVDGRYEGISIQVKFDQMD